MWRPLSSCMVSVSALGAGDGWFPRLKPAGHDVHAVTLTGCGANAHRATAEIDVDVHRRDVQEYLELEDLSDVILVGHGYGGMVITATAASPRIAKLIYLDACVPENRSFLDDGPGELATDVRTRATEGLVPPALMIEPLSSQLDSHWFRQRLRPHPLRCLEQPVPPLPPAQKNRIFVRCTESSNPWTPCLRATRGRNGVCASRNRRRPLRHVHGHRRNSPTSFTI